MLKTQSSASELPALWLTQLSLLCVAAYYYGARVWILGMIAVLTCFVLNFFCVYLRRLPFQFSNLDAVSTGLTLALMMPASVPYDILIISCFAAIIIGKQVFGGRQNLLFPPAAVGYLFAVVSWREEMLQFPEIHTHLPLIPTVSVPTDISLSAAYNADGVFRGDPNALWLGLCRGPMGTTAGLLLIVCGIILLARCRVSVPAVSGAVIMLALNFLILPLSGSVMESLRNGMLTNMTLFSTIYLIGDKRLAPKGFPGFLFGALIAAMGLYFTLITKLEYGIVLASVAASPIGVALRRDEEKRAAIAKGKEDKSRLNA